MNMSDYTKRNIVIILYIITFIYFYSIYLMIYTEKKWNDVKCSPLVILSNKLINYNNNNDVLRNCLGNVENEIYSTINNNYNSMITEIDHLVKGVYINDSKFIKELGTKYDNEFLKIQDKITNINSNKEEMEKKLDENKEKLDVSIGKINNYLDNVSPDDE